MIKTRQEIIYRLTELYVPKSESTKKKMIEFNKDKMHHINYEENDLIRKNKRKVKEEIKSDKMKQKLRHQIRYCNPTPLTDDAIYLYTPGMTTR